MPQPIRGRAAILFFLSDGKTKRLGRGQVSLNSVPWFSEEKSKMSQPIRGRVVILVFFFLVFFGC